MFKKYFFFLMIIYITYIIYFILHILYIIYLYIHIYIYRLDNIVDENNKTYHRIIKMKPVDFQSSRYIEFYLENNDRILYLK